MVGHLLRQSSCLTVLFEGLLEGCQDQRREEDTRKETGFVKTEIAGPQIFGLRREKEEEHMTTNDSYISMKKYKLQHECLILALM